MQMPVIDNQLTLSFAQTESGFLRILEEQVGRDIVLCLTSNASSMLSARLHQGALHVRLHRMFLTADEKVVGEIASFLSKKRCAMPCFRRFLRENKEQIQPKPAKRIRARTAGKCHDLCQLFTEINDEYFAGKVDALITWGSRQPRTSVRKRTLGSYSEGSNVIRINPVLDRNSVPRYYIAFVVYHEMLHAALGIAKKGGRRSIHSRDFRTREKLFKDYERAIGWEGK